MTIAPFRILSIIDSIHIADQVDINMCTSFDLSFAVFSNKMLNMFSKRLIMRKIMQTGSSM